MSSSLAQIVQHLRRLDGQVSRDKTVPLVDGDFITFQGSLSPSGKIVAIRCPRFLSRDNEGVEPILHGIITSSLLRHEDITPFLGVATFDDRLSTVTEFVVRGNANDYVQDPQVDPTPLLLGVARGLRYLHGHALGPIYHGDVRGRNVLIAGDGRALLTGFECSFISNPSFSDMTLTYPIVGALRWMAPEGIDGGRATAERDVWAFAMTALELFTRKMPFPHTRSNSGVIIRILRGELDYPMGLSGMWQNLCTTCWESDPALRPDMMTIVSKIEETLPVLTNT